MAAYHHAGSEHNFRWSLRCWWWLHSVWYFHLCMPITTPDDNKRLFYLAKEDFVLGDHGIARGTGTASLTVSSDMPALKYGGSRRKSLYHATWFGAAGNMVTCRQRLKRFILLRSYRKSLSQIPLFVTAGTAIHHLQEVTVVLEASSRKPLPSFPAYTIIQVICNIWWNPTKDR